MTPRRRSDLDRWPEHPVPTSFSVAEVVPEPGAPHRVMLLLGGSESSFLDLEDPAYLEFEYMQHVRAVVDAALGPPGTTPPDDATRDPRTARFVHLGGAACALPRALLADRPHSRHLVVELDTELARLVRAWFDLPRAPALRIRNAEARESVEHLHPGSVDVLVRDVFVDAEVPEHVRTVQFVRAAAEALAPGGIYVLNLTDSPGLRRVREEAAALTSVFGEVLGVVDPAVWKGRRYGNVVLVASHHRLDAAAVDRGLRRLPFPAIVVGGAELAHMGAGTAAPLDPPAIA
ncbi:spermidine synthase [Georgenia sp. Z1344]|uniref:spermidine synthase n=1 Tax=Georgenia sp. Z1344 TaxID=3416706 RepID=UPI003CF56E2E